MDVRFLPKMAGVAIRRQLAGRSGLPSANSRSYKHTGSLPDPILQLQEVGKPCLNV
jgi:hypothetical protein